MLTHFRTQKEILLFLFTPWQAAVDFRMFQVLHAEAQDWIQACLFRENIHLHLFHEVNNIDVLRENDKSGTHRPFLIIPLVQPSSYGIYHVLVQ